MIKIFFLFKDKIKELPKYTKFIIKCTLILVLTCLILSLTCFLIKDTANRYIFLSNLSHELLIVARSCGALGLIFAIIGFNIEKTELQS
ncbi:MAG: hypothetical protein E7557_00435 [Ruminococcaceae bacterium]|nr:hypothetical protein [Oscillospiraceae bacterium]